MSAKREFVETQGFDQWWLRYSLFGLFVFTTYVWIKQLIFGIPFGQNPAPDWLVVIFSLFAYGLIVLFFKAQLRTRIDDREIHVRFVPFYERIWSWDDVEDAEVINYGFIGGWGYRLSLRYGTVYNTKGTYGLFIQLKNGKKFTIGTQKVDELSKFIADL